jgi:lysophospholipase L1-like esterase
MKQLSPKKIPSKLELGLFFIGLLLSLGIGAGCLYYFEPRLFNAPADLKVVQLDTKLSPFFEGVFRSKDLQSTDFFRQDPLTVVRGLPFLAPIQGVGPHDALGFRNASIPFRAPVVTVGDSQTYGINASLTGTWPAELQRNICDGYCPVYNMALGSWAAPQYLYAVQKAAAFRPAHVIVALYSGNDSLETFRTVYSVNYWKSLRVDPELSVSDMPKIQFPPDPSTLWTTALSDSSSMTFAPSLRLPAVSLKDSVISTAYTIIEKTLKDMSASTKSYGAQLWLTIVPTKELVYARRLQDESINLPDAFTRLIMEETARTEQLLSFAQSAGISTIELLPALQEAVLKNNSLYPEDSNGHPLVAGYKLIGRIVSKEISEKLPPLKETLYQVTPGNGETWYYLFRDGVLRKFSGVEQVTENGWNAQEATQMEFEQLAFLLPGEAITAKDHVQFAPR